MRAVAAWRLQSQRFQGTDDLAQDLGCHLHIQRGGLSLLLPDQGLDHADIHLLLQQMGGKAVTLMPRAA